MMIILRYIVCFVISGMLSACSLFSPLKTECINEYVVDAVPCVKSKSSMTAKTLAVSVPTTSRIYQTKQMAYSTHIHKVDYFAKNKWAIAPAPMLQPLVVQALQNTHHFKAVAPSIGAGRFDLMLNTQLIQFHQEFCSHGSDFTLKVRAQLISVSTGKIIASKEFSVVELAPTANPYGGVVAANRATEKMLTQLAQWCSRY